MIRSLSTFSRVGNTNWPFYVEGTVYNVRPATTCPLAYSHLPTVIAYSKYPQPASGLAFRESIYP